MYPKTIKLAAMLFALSVIAAVISGYIEYQNTPQAAARQVIMAVALIFIVPYAILFAYIMKRRNWARMTWLVFFVLGTLLMIFNHHSAHYAHVSLRYFAALQPLLQVTITVLLFLPPSNRWFRRQTETPADTGE